MKRVREHPFLVYTNEKINTRLSSIYFFLLLHGREGNGQYHSYKYSYKQ